MKHSFLLLFLLAFSLFFCAQKAEKELPEDFVERFRKALASPSPSILETDFLMTKAEHREFSKAAWPTYFEWDKEPKNGAVEKRLDQFHERFWADYSKKYSRQLAEIWRGAGSDFWANARFFDIQIDTSAAHIGGQFARADKPKSVRVAVISAKYDTAGDPGARQLKTPVCSILRGRGKSFRTFKWGIFDSFFKV